MKLNDRYSEAKINVDSDHYKARIDALEQLRNKLKLEQVLDLAEYLYELVDAPTDGWLAEKLMEHDPTFSVHSNAREVRLLSAQLLENEIAEDKPLAGLVVLTGEVMGMRKCAEVGLLSEHMETELSKYSSYIRNPKINLLKQPAVLDATEEVTKAITAANAQNAFLQVHTALDAIYNEILEPHPAILKNVKVINMLSESMAFMREESDLLWWHISEWSDIAGGSHTELSQELAAVLLPFDAANIIKRSPGPVALPALLKRALIQRPSKLKTKKKITITTAVEAVGQDILEKLPIATGKMQAPGIFPFIFALKTAKEVGTEGLWRKPFVTFTGLDPDTDISVAAIAIQISRELDALKLVE